MNLRRSHPASSLIYLLVIISYTMFSKEIFLLAFSLFTGVFTQIFIDPKKITARSIFWNLIFFALIILLNPLFNQTGETELLRIGKLRVTEEALLAGLKIGLMTLAVIFWFNLFNQIITSEKFIYLFGNLAPSTTLLLSMGLKYLPLYRRQYERISEAQRAMGKYGEGYFRKVVNRVRTFIALLAWSLENALDTASSMKARGYGLKKRSHYALYRFRKSDFGLIIISLLFLSFLILDLIFILPYRYIGIILIFSYGALLEIKENFKWHYLRSKI